MSYFHLLGDILHTISAKNRVSPKGLQDSLIFKFLPTCRYCYLTIPHYSGSRSRITRKTLFDLQLEIAPETSDVIFVSVRTKGKLTTRAIGFIMKYAERAGLDIHPHDLRHRFGYRMAKSTPLHRLAQIMDHDSIDRQ